jgi:hypothetical protein
MKKPSSKIREDIARLQEQLKHAETREAERIGRVALRAGLGEIETEEADLLAAFEALATRFRAGKPGTIGRKAAGDGGAGGGQSETVASGTTSSGDREV